MRERRLCKWFIKWIARFVYWSSMAYTLFMGVFFQSQGKNFIPDWISQWEEALTNTALYLLPSATVLVAFSGWILSRISPAKIDNAVKGLLDDFRVNAFPDEDPEIDHRVTIFKYCKWHPYLLMRFQMWGGCLVPYERSGEFHLNSRICFLSPKNAPDKCEGVAGMVFKTRQCQYISKLPEIGSKKKGKNIIKKYADQTNVEVSWVNERIKNNQNHFSRSFWGFPIEVNGNLWGVFLVDSRAEELSGKEELKQHYKQVGLCLSNLLSKK